MKMEKIILGLFFSIVCFAFGVIVGQEYATKDIDPHQCVSVCVEELEKMAG